VLDVWPLLPGKRQLPEMRGEYALRDGDEEGAQSMEAAPGA
jgi:hypothetical protein